MQSIITDNLLEIQRLCREHGVQELYAFGSVTRDDFRPDSDVDLLVRFTEATDKQGYARDYFAIDQSLNQLLCRDIQLIALYRLSNPYFIKELNQTAVKLYGAFA